ncbi:MAG: putative EF hand protein, partial [Streblomastix strix]
MSFNVAIQKIIQQSKLKGIRTKEFFADYDHLRSGRVSHTQFERVINVEKFTITPDEVQALIEHYIEPDGKQVNYRRFIEDVDSAFFQRELDKTTTSQITPDTRIKSPRRQLHPDEEVIFQQVMIRIQKEVQTRRMDLLPLFKDYDRLKNHHITKISFMRSIPFHLSVDEVEIICLKYTDGEERDGINYFQFVNDASDPAVKQSRASPYENTHQLEPVYQQQEQKPEPLAVMKKIQATAQRGQIRLYDFFRYFDEMHYGVILPEDFRPGLAHAK